MTEARMSGRHLGGDAVAPRAGARLASAAQPRPASVAVRTPASRRKPASRGNAAGRPLRAALARTAPTRMASADCTVRRAHRAGRSVSGVAVSRCLPLVRPWLCSPCWRLKPIWWPAARVRSIPAPSPQPIHISSAQAPAPHVTRLLEKARPLGGRHFGARRP
jgi:hypothetical protein